MVTSNDVPINDLIQAIAKEFKEMPEMKAPEWAFYVKTGNHKERPPVDKDWWYTRAAAVLRTVSVRGPIGVNKLRSKYGGKKNMGVRPEHTVKGSGSIARKILQQLEIAKLIKQDKKGVHKGRIITAEGIALLNKASASVYKPTDKKEKPEATPVEKSAKPVEKIEKKADDAKKTSIKKDMKEKSEKVESKPTDKAKAAPAKSDEKNADDNDTKKIPVKTEEKVEVKEEKTEAPAEETPVEKAEEKAEKKVDVKEEKAEAKEKTEPSLKSEEKKE